MLTAQLATFLYTARSRGYAVVRDVPVLREPDGSSTLLYESGGWRYHDNYFGGNPFAGREVVHHDRRPVWMMVYCGGATADADAGDAFRWLREALRAAPVDALRGPTTHDGAGWRYVCQTDGDIERFTGSEAITRDGVDVYRAHFAGGWVDRADAL